VVLLGALFLPVAACGDGTVFEVTHVDAPTPTVPATSTTAATTTSTAPTTTAAPRRARLLFTGDSMAHDRVIQEGRAYGQAIGASYDFTPMWRLLQPVISRADLAICHVETTFAAGDEAPSGFPRFRAPREYATALQQAGYDACSTASNHSYDYGVEGVVRTIEVLEQSGLRWAGTARSAEEGAQASVYDAGGVRVAHLSATYGLNGFRLPADQPWLVDPIDVPRLLTEAQLARAAGAEIVVVSLHCCTEYRVEPTGPQLEHFAHLLASPDVDLVVGHHAHVVQPIERIGDEYAVYGLGNILSNMYDSRCCPAASQDGVAVEIEFVEGTDGRFRAEAVEYTPTWVDRTGGFVVTPVVAALADPSLAPDRRAQLDASLARTVAAIGSRGGAEQGVTLSDGR
jgi:hypothetical protein